MDGQIFYNFIEIQMCRFLLFFLSHAMTITNVTGERINERYFERTRYSTSLTINMLRFNFKLDLWSYFSTGGCRIDTSTTVLVLGYVRQTQGTGTTRQELGRKPKVNLQRIRHSRGVHFLHGLRAG